MKYGAVLLSLGVFLVLPNVVAQTPGSFTATGSMITPRFAHTATLLADGRVLITGGCIDQSGLGATPPFCGNTVTASAEIYDPATGTFVASGNMTTERAYHTATLLSDGRVLIAGGSKCMTTLPSCSPLDDGGGGPNYGMTSAELYDPSSGTFAATGSMNNRSIVGTSAATLLLTGQVLVTAAGSYAELYDPISGSFTITGDGIAPPGFETANLLSDGRVLIGDKLYDPRTGKFSPAANEARYLGSRSILLPNGEVLGAGGDDDWGPSSAASLYDSANQRFLSTGWMITPRADHTITLLPSGKALIAGGSTWVTSPTPDGREVMYHVCCALTAELYDSVIGAFANTGSIAAARKGHTATLLNNGDVLIAGGSGGGYPGALPTAEIYHPEPVNPGAPR